MRAKEFTDETMHLVGYIPMSNLKYGDKVRYKGSMGPGYGAIGEVGEVDDEHGMAQFFSDQDGRSYTVPTKHLTRILKR